MELAQVVCAFVLGFQSQPKTEDLSLEDLLRTPVAETRAASRYVQKLSEAPASVSVITAEEIRRYGHRTLADVLRGMRGVYVTNDRNYSYLGVRGFGIPADYNDRVLFLVDGHRVNDNVYDGALFGRDCVIDVDLVDRVEFVRGPASSLYGSSAYFGVVSITIRKGAQVGGAELSAAAGSFGSYQGRAGYGRRFENGLEVHVSGSAYDSEGQTHFYPEFGAAARGADGETASNAFAQVSYGDFTLQAAWVAREKRIPTGSFGTLFPSRHTATWDERGYLDLRFEREFEDRLRVLARVFADAYEYRGNYEYEDATVVPPLVYRNKDVTAGYGWGAEALVTKTLGEDRAKLAVGAEYRDDFRQDQENFDSVDPKVTYLDSEEDSHLFGLFGQADLLLLPELRLNAGVRYDHYDSFGGSVNPRAGLIWTAWEGSAVKGLYGRAFRAPSAFELHYQDGGMLQKASPDLEAEIIDTYEAVLEQDLGAGVRLSAGVFHYRCDDMITAVLDPADGLLFFDNVSEVKTTGFEAEVSANLASGLGGRASYSYQQAKNADTGSWLVNSPRHLAKLNLTAPVGLDYVYAGFELQYVGERRTLAGDRTDDSFVANLTFTAREVAKGLDLSVGVYNLLDEEYFDPGSIEHVQDRIEQDGLSFRIKATLRF
jgi:iron complex outermembrane receptor protein